MLTVESEQRIVIIDALAVLAQKLVVAGHEHNDALNFLFTHAMSSIADDSIADANRNALAAVLAGARVLLEKPYDS
jgi:hypothetical protein